MANSSDPVIEDISCPSNGIHLSQCPITIPTDSSICSVNVHCVFLITCCRDRWACYIHCLRSTGSCTSSSLFLLPHHFLSSVGRLFPLSVSSLSSCSSYVWTSSNTEYWRDFSEFYGEKRDTVEGVDQKSFFDTDILDMLSRKESTKCI